MAQFYQRKPVRFRKEGSAPQQALADIALGGVLGYLHPVEGKNRLEGEFKTGPNSGTIFFEW